MVFIPYGIVYMQQTIIICKKAKKHGKGEGQKGTPKGAPLFSLTYLNTITNIKHLRRQYDYLMLPL